MKRRKAKRRCTLPSHPSTREQLVDALDTAKTAVKHALDTALRNCPQIDHPKMIIMVLCSELHDLVSCYEGEQRQQAADGIVNTVTALMQLKPDEEAEP